MILPDSDAYTDGAQGLRCLSARATLEYKFGLRVRQVFGGICSVWCDTQIPTTYGNYKQQRLRVAADGRRLPPE